MIIPKQTIKVKCPNCGVILEVTNVNNELQRRITCPGCNKGLIVKFPQPQKEDAKTQVNQGGGSTAEDKTEIGGVKKGIMSCALECNGKTYPLEIGENSVGRKATSSSADVQIETNDLYMSREHILITVRRLASGALKADVRNHKNKNATRVNGQQLQPSDAIVLNNGDKIRMGETTVVFVAK